jgi:hypothetical protein
MKFIMSPMKTFIRNGAAPAPIVKTTPKPNIYFRSKRESQTTLELVALHFNTHVLGALFLEDLNPNLRRHLSEVANGALKIGSESSHDSKSDDREPLQRARPEKKQ